MPADEARTIAKLLQERITQLQKDRDFFQREARRKAEEEQKQKEAAQLQQDLLELKEHKERIAAAQHQQQERESSQVTKCALAIRSVGVSGRGLSCGKPVWSYAPDYEEALRDREF